MTDQRWSLSVRNASPTVRQRSGGAGEAAWRRAIANAVEAAYPDAPFERPPMTRFEVDVVFRMTADELAREAVDLDNLAKPILDTVFTSKNVSSDIPTGVLFDENDTWVFVLRLEKVMVPSPEERGADISVAATSRPPRAPG